MVEEEFDEAGSEIEPIEPSPKMFNVALDVLINELFPIALPQFMNIDKVDPRNNRMSGFEEAAKKMSKKSCYLHSLIS